MVHRQAARPRLGMGNFCLKCTSLQHRGAAAVLAQSLELDPDLFFNLVKFVGHGVFIVGKHGAYEDARANDFETNDSNE